MFKVINTAVGLHPLCGCCVFKGNIIKKNLISQEGDLTGTPDLEFMNSSQWDAIIL